MTGQSGGTLILLRHGRSTANTDGVLAGRSEGVDLDDTGAAQAAGLVDRLAGARIARLVSSPLLRCRRTLAPLAAALGLPVTHDDRIAEVDYGSWTGRRLSELSDEPLWRTVQLHPAAAVFPDGEALSAVSVRAVQAAREHAAATVDAGAVLLCTHGDVIKAILADALGLHLDSFQRLVVSPASVSVVRYGPLRTFVERVNDTGSLAGIGEPPPPPPGEAAAATATGTDRSGDAVVGGDGGRPVASPQPAGPVS
jgi:probable phosphoglycerate mutase